MTEISPYFNQTSNKVLKIDDLISQYSPPPAASQERDVARAVIMGMAGDGFKDGQGNLYVRERTLKEEWTLWISMKPATERQEAERIQKEIDQCRDYTPELKAGQLLEVSFAIEPVPGP